MSKQLMDDEINLKRRARSRLIGATALTVIVVAALPMLLDDEPKSVGQDIELRIPDKDKVGEFIPRMAASSVSATSAVSPSSAPAITNPVTQSASAAITQAGTSPQTVETKLVTTNPETRTVTSTSTEKKRSPPRLAGFVVQVGAFANSDTANQRQKELSKQGIKAYTERVGDKTRVRAGPYPTRESADVVYKKLESQGFKPTVVAVD